MNSSDENRQFYKFLALFLTVLTITYLAVVVLKNAPEVDFSSASVKGIYSHGVATRDDGVITINGQPIFLYGFVHVNEYNNRNGTTLANDIEMIGAAGFNHVQMGITDDNGLQGTQAARNKFVEHNIYNIASYYKPSYTTWINAMKDDPRTIGWNTHDDFNVPYSSPNFTPSQRLTETNTFRSYADSVNYDTLIFGSGGGYPYNRNVGTFGYRTTAQVPYLFADYNDSMDIVGVQTYPISNNDESFANAPLEENIQYLKYARQVIPASKPVIANLQSFRWSGAGNRYPTAPEARNMTWAAIVMRVEGIAYYAYYDATGLLPTAANALWNELVQTRLDIQGDPNGDVNGAFMRAYLDGTYTYFDSNPGVMGSAKIHAATFRYNDSVLGKDMVYAVVLNTSSSASLPTTNLVELPVGIDNATQTALYGSDTRYGSTMTINEDGGQKFLNGTLSPMQVQVYSFEIEADEEEPTPTPTATPSPTFTPTPTTIEPTFTPTPTDIIDPTATPTPTDVLPTATPTPTDIFEPTSTPTPTQILPTATFTPTPTVIAPTPTFTPTGIVSSPVIVTPTNNSIPANGNGQLPDTALGDSPIDKIIIGGLFIFAGVVYFYVDRILEIRKKQKYKDKWENID